MTCDSLDVLIVSTETANNTENHDPEDDDILALALTTLWESDRGEGGDPDEDVSVIPTPQINAALSAMATTRTKASGDEEQDDEEDEYAFAMSTTCTSTIGQQESDPDENDVLVRSCGDVRPLLYRFREPGLDLKPNLQYDTASQVHRIPDGRLAIDAILERVRTLR